MDELEDLRYRWMLYKSKLKDSSLLLVGAQDARGPGPGGDTAPPTSTPPCVSADQAETHSEQMETHGSWALDLQFVIGHSERQEH